MDAEEVDLHHLNGFVVDLQEKYGPFTGFSCIGIVHEYMEKDNVEGLNRRSLFGCPAC